MGIETYKKEQDKLEKEEKQKTNPDSEEKETLTIREIIADRENSSLFGKMMENEGGPEDVKLMTRLAEGKLEEEDIEALEKHRKVFEKRIRGAEKIKGDLTQEMVLEIGAQNPEFQKIINIVGSEKAVSIIQSQMNELAITDNVRFLSIYKKIEKTKDFKKEETKRLNDSVKELCKKENINEDEYLKALAIIDKDEREESIKKLVEKSWGKKDFLARTFGKDTRGMSAQELIDKKIEIDDLFKQLNKQKKDIGGTLASTLKGNENMLKALSKAITGKSEKKEAHAGMKESQESFMEEEDIDKAWEEYKKTVKVGNDKWDKLTDAQKDIERANFGGKLKKEAAEKAKKKAGFWSSIFQSLFNPFIDDKITKLK